MLGPASDAAFVAHVRGAVHVGGADGAFEEQPRLDGRGGFADRVAGQALVPHRPAAAGVPGLGFALAMQVADKSYMLENAIYSVIAPESCCRIIFHRRLTAGEDIEDVLPDALNILRPGYEHLKQIGMIDEVLLQVGNG